MIKLEFVKYTLTAEMLCLGERIKKGTFKPTIRTIPYSQISGALRKYFGENDVHAVGHLVIDGKHNRIDYLTYSPRDRKLETSKLPITIEFLTNVVGKVYIAKNDKISDYPKEFEIYMGAMKYRGFGLCKLKKEGEFKVDFCKKYNRECVEKVHICKERKKDHIICGVIMKRADGILNTRIPKKHIKRFEIKRIGKAVYGYLFEPTSEENGKYVLSLFEGSEIAGPEFLLSKGVNEWI